MALGGGDVRGEGGPSLLSPVRGVYGHGDDPRMGWGWGGRGSLFGTLGCTKLGLVGVRDPKWDILAPGCEWWTGPGPWRRLRLDLAAAAAVTGGGGGSQNPNPSFFDVCGRSRDDFYGVLTVRTLRVFFALKNQWFFDMFQPWGVWNPSGGLESKIPKSKSQNPKSQNPKIQNLG